MSQFIEQEKAVINITVIRFPWENDLKDQRDGAALAYGSDGDTMSRSAPYLGRDPREIGWLLTVCRNRDLYRNGTASAHSLLS